jgi:ABC-type antimicrobial peptide transport system ATPase subunit
VGYRVVSWDRLGVSNIYVRVYVGNNSLHNHLADEGVHVLQYEGAVLEITLTHNILKHAGECIVRMIKT